MSPLEPTAARLKNDQIKETLKKTRERRKKQSCRVFHLKIDKSHLSQQVLKHLTTLFLQAKWLTNAVIASEDIFAFDSKVKEVSVKIGDKEETRSISLLSPPL